MSQQYHTPNNPPKNSIPILRQDSSDSSDDDNQVVTAQPMPQPRPTPTKRPIAKPIPPRKKHKKGGTKKKRLVTNLDKRRAAGWHAVKPHSKEERHYVINKFGKDCFLKPEQMKYPVCDINGNFDCRGIIAAKFWADTAETKAKKSRKKRPYSFKKISKKAKYLGKNLNCAAFN